MAEIYKEFHGELGWMYVPKTIAQILTDVSTISGVSRKLMILEFHVQALEEEMRRIDTYKCQLPHCMHFFEDAIEILKHEISKWKRSVKCLSIEEFMPLKSGLEESSRVKLSTDDNEKREWMRSVQLWYDNDQDNNLHYKSSSEGNEASGTGVKFKHKGEASMPLKRATMANKRVASVSSSVAKYEVELIDLNVPTENSQQQELNPELPSKKQRRFKSIFESKSFFPI